MNNNETRFKKLLQQRQEEIELLVTALFELRTRVEGNKENVVVLKENMTNFRKIHI